MTDFVTIEGRTLAKAMKTVNAIVELRCVTPVLASVRLRYGPAGLEIAGTDMDMEFRARVDEIDGSGEWSICINAFRLARIAHAAGVADVNIEPTSQEAVRTGRKGDPDITYIQHGATITVGGGEATYHISNVHAADDWPEIVRERGDLIERFTNGMLAATLQKVAWAISTEETRYYLNGVAMQRNANGRRFAATDGHRLALCRYDGEPSNAVESRIIPRKTVAFLINHFQGVDVEIFATSAENVIDLVSPIGTLRTKLIDGNFPDIDRVVPKPQAVNHVIELKREEIMNAIRQATAVGGESRRSAGPVIRLHGRDGCMHIERKNVEFGTATVKTSTVWPADAEEIGFNSRYVTDIVSRCQGAIKLGVTDKGSPAVVGDDDETMTRVVMPMRV